jgi:hypothetical protein
MYSGVCLVSNESNYWYNIQPASLFAAFGVMQPEGLVYKNLGRSQK